MMLPVISPREWEQLPVRLFEKHNMRNDWLVKSVAGEHSNTSVTDTYISRVVIKSKDCFQNRVEPYVTLGLRIAALT
jgi:hypothetical protein